jgi:hypothetical protein
VTQQAGSDSDSFFGDLRLALAAWITDPRLPLLTVVLVFVTATPALVFPINVYLGQAAVLVLLPVSLFLTGFYGTQRIWYLRIFRGGRLSTGELWSITWKLLPRYLVLGVLCGIPYLIFGFAMVAVGIVFSVSFPAVLRGSGNAIAHAVVLAAFFVAVDLALTFVTPALAYTTSNPTEAVRIGLRMIRRTWPHAALYVLFPPLAFQLGAYLPRALELAPRGVILAVIVIAGVANLAAKGATAAFYLRRAEVPDDGALHHDNPAPV